MTKKILIFSLAYYPNLVGGAEVAIKEITDRIPVSDFEFDMITARFDSDLPRFEKIGNVNVYRVGFGKTNPDPVDLLKFPLVLNKTLFPFFSFIKASQLNRKRKYNIAWAMMANYAGFGAMFFKLFNPKVSYLLTLQEGDPIDYIKRRVRFVYPLFVKIFTKADSVQVISRYLAGFAGDMGFKGKVDIIPNGVDIRKFSHEFKKEELVELKKKLNKEEDDKFIITTSRLVPKNAVDDVITSLKFLPDNFKFLVLGIGPDLASLQKLAKESGVDMRVLFLGQISHDELPKYLNISDVFVRPSLSEGMGNSFIEAMAAQIPVIATPVGGIVDFLFDPDNHEGKQPTGLFCKVRDPKDLSNRILKIINNKELRAVIVENAKKMVDEKYDWSLVANKMKILLSNLCSKRSTEK